ncbi:hypothetical protein O181_065653 [Austropuccinia psidii MF-1]|uniref:Uncharacterized protein n=1 Tax=Austropuccinia psidii MF-1 TaxID=1389203 RepID=A0A9Q3I2T9_9BASI|nr:hypothetical protein [Austropuccinia psidii MF-1]
MVCLVLALNLELKMSSKLTSICDSNHSDSLPFVLYGSGVFDNFKELSEESMAPTEIYAINKIYDGFQSVRFIEPPCIDCWKKGAKHRFPDNPRRLRSSIKKSRRFELEAPVDELPTSDATSGHSNCDLNDQGTSELLTSMVLFSSASVTGSTMIGVQQWTNISISWANTGGPIRPQGNPIGIAPEVPISVTRKDGRLVKLKRNLVVQDENDTDSEGSDEIYGEELEITTPIQKRRIQSNLLSPVPVSTTTHEVIRSSQPPQPSIRSPSRPTTLASTSTNIQPPVASPSRDPVSPEPESIFDNH